MSTGIIVRTKGLVRTVLSAALFLTATQPAMAVNLTRSNIPYEQAVHDYGVITIDAKLSVSNSNGQAVVTINAKSGGIRIEQGAGIDNDSSPSIYVSEIGTLIGALDNEGIIQDGVVIAGRSTPQTGMAYRSRGKDNDNWAGLQGGYKVQGNGGIAGGVVETMNDHAVFLDDHSYMDFIAVDSGSSLKSSGDGTAAVYVSENAQMGGTLPSGTVLNSESDTVFDIAGTLSSSNGQAINIAGEATGEIKIASSGVLSGKGGGEAGGAALLVSGTYTGSLNSQGTIKGGVFISGTHDASQEHAVFLNGQSKTDLIAVTGTMTATGASKSAVYVENGAQLGGIVVNGGTIKASGNNSSAITVQGDLTGKVYLKDGSITAASATDTSLDFSSSNKPLMFEQVGNNSKTTGTILASDQHKNDWVAFRGGSFEGETIQNVDHLVVSTITSGITMSGNFTLPAQTTIELVKQQQLDDQNRPVTDSNQNPVYELNSNALMTVTGRLSAMEQGSNIQFKPASLTEYDLVKKGVTLTVVEPGSMEGSVAGRVTVDSGSYLVEATENYSAGKLQVQLKSRDANGVKQLVMKSGANSRASEVFSKAVDVVNTGTYVDATRGGKLFAKLNATNYDAKKLAGQVQPRVAGEVQKSSQTVANTAHNIVFNRIHGLRRGISYGDQFTDGAVWGQMLYNSGKQDDVDGEPGFKNQAWGITLGVDGELDSAIRMGLALSMVSSTVDGNEGSTNKSYSYLTTWYNSWNGRGYFLDTMLSMGSSANDMTKTIDGYRVKADFEVDQWGGRVIGGTNWRVGNWTLSPQTEFNYGLVRVQEYEEKGDSGFEQKIQSKDYNTWELGGGMKFNGEYWYRNGVIKPELTFMGYYDFGTDGTTVKSTYLAGGESFMVTGPDRDKVRLHMGLGLGLQMNNRWTLHTGYNFNWKKSYRSHSFSAKARYEF